MEDKNNLSIFYSDIHLFKWIEKISKSSIYETIFGLIIYFLFTLRMYFGSNSIDIWFFAWLLVSTLFLALYIYGGTIKRGKVINNTVKSINFDKNYMSILTFSYNMLFFKKLDSKIIKIPFNNTNVKEENYPILDKKNINGKVLMITDHNRNQYYIILKFFPNNLIDNLNHFQN